MIRTIVALEGNPIDRETLARCLDTERVDVISVCTPDMTDKDRLRLHRDSILRAATERQKFVHSDEAINDLDAHHRNAIQDEVDQAVELAQSINKRLLYWPTLEKQC